MTQYTERYKPLIDPGWLQYVTDGYARINLTTLQNGWVLTDVSKQVLSVKDVADQLEVSDQTARALIRDRFAPIERGKYRTPDNSRHIAPSVYVITQRMLDKYMTEQDPETFIDSHGSEHVQILTLKEAADTFAVTINRLRNAISRGDLPAKKVGLWIVLAYDVLKFLATPATPHKSRAQFTDDQVLSMRSWRWEESYTLPMIQKKAIADYGVTADISTISRIVSGNTYSHLGGVKCLSKD